MGHHRGPARGRRWHQTTDRLARSSESGAALIIALCFIMVFGVILAALLTYAGSSVRADRVYRQVRTQRYDATNAIDLAINTVRNQYRMGRDPKLSSNDPKCRFENQPQDSTGKVITVSCAAKSGAGSGKPAQGGLVPDDAIVALGTRHNESPPYNQANCGIAGLGSDATTEKSILFRTSQVRQGTDLGGIFCSNRSRPSNTFSVRGNIKAAGKVEVSNGNVTLVAKSATEPSTITTPSGSSGGCTGAISPACVTTSSAITDPGAGGTNSAWANVPIDWNAHSDWATSVPVPAVRNTAYTWNGTQLVPASTCSSQGTLIFLPGFYNDATVLNKYTADGNCKEATFWLAPSPGPDGIPATDDDVTGAYYFGFRNTNNTACSSSASQARRWCIGGGAADSSPRVVVGSAKGWNPLSTTTGGPTTRTVTINRADTVDSGLSQSWFNGGGAKVIGDGSVAEYRATAPPLLCPAVVCFSSDRSIRVRDLQPKVAAAPDRVSGNAGPITVEIAHRETDSSLDNPRIEIRAVGDESGITANCSGSFFVPRSTTALTTAKVRLGSGTAAQQEAAAANAIGNCFQSADLINGIQITMKVGGNTTNQGSPKVYLDGVQLSFTSTPRATFPLPVSTGTSAEANIDCDPEGPGAQLIFGGDAHAYVADGSLEICAGAYPTDIEDHQQIGVWQVPAVAPIRPTTASKATPVVGPDVSVSNPNNARQIAEPTGTAVASISRSASCNASGVTCVLGTGGGTQEAGLNLDFPAYSPPAGLSIERVDVRATYDSNGFITSPQLAIDGCEGRTSFQPSELRQAFNFGLVSDSRDLTSCLSGKLGDGFKATWYARSAVACLFGGCVGNISGDQLDGLELIVTLKPTDATSKTLIPASGCTQSYPNYWAGTGSPDCAVLKADSIQTTPIISGLFPQEANWYGRFTVQGTIYAPSGAVEIDDSDAAYPSASRGMVVRHLRVTGYKTRSGYSGPAVDTVISKNTNPREMVFTACLQSTARRTAGALCDSSQDQVLSRAKVRYEIDPATVSGATQPLARIPRVQWWSVDR